MNTVYILFLNEKLNKNEISWAAKEFVKRKAAEKLNISPKNIVFEATANGKPYIKNYPDFHFNISHTACAIAVALSNSPIGIDIEKIRKADLRVAKRFFTPEENEYISAENSDTRFFEIWTQKESYIKKNGLTMSSIKACNSDNIHTFAEKGYIISVCADNTDRSKINFLDL